MGSARHDLTGAYVCAATFLERDGCLSLFFMDVDMRRIEDDGRSSPGLVGIYQWGMATMVRM